MEKVCGFYTNATGQRTATIQSLVTCMPVNICRRNGITLSYCLPGGPLSKQCCLTALVRSRKSVSVTPDLVALQWATLRASYEPPEVGSISWTFVPKSLWELRPILHRLELTLREGIVIGHVRTTVGLGDAKGREQLGHVVRSHRRASIAVQRQLLLADLLLADRFLN